MAQRPDTRATRGMEQCLSLADKRVATARLGRCVVYGVCPPMSGVGRPVGVMTARLGRSAAYGPWLIRHRPGPDIVHVTQVTMPWLGRWVLNNL